MSLALEEAPQLWQAILRADPEKIFGQQASRLQNRNWGDRLAQPGYLGARYQKRGLVFISMNPGGGSELGLNPDDQLQYEALNALREAEENDLVSEFATLTRVLSDVMPRWKIYKNFVAPVLASGGVDFSSVAYINLLKWRTTSSSELGQLYKLSWSHHMRDQIELLAPSQVIAIGTDAARAFRRYYDCRDLNFDFIPRVIGNNVGRDGLAALARIAAIGPLARDSKQDPLSEQH